MQVFKFAMFKTKKKNDGRVSKWEGQDQVVEKGVLLYLDFDNFVF